MLSCLPVQVQVTSCQNAFETMNSAIQSLLIVQNELIFGLDLFGLHISSEVLNV